MEPAQSLALINGSSFASPSPVASEREGVSFPPPPSSALRREVRQRANAAAARPSARDFESFRFEATC